MSVNLNATHWDSAVWGEDVNEFKPSRWIAADAIDGAETFIGAPDGAEVFLWAFGPRICPGKKFSQVEFVAAMACLLKDRSIKTSIMSDESIAEANDRLKKIVFESDHILSMNIRQPEKAAILIIPRL